VPWGHCGHNGDGDLAEDAGAIFLTGQEAHLDVRGKEGGRVGTVSCRGLWKAHGRLVEG
jgi:hypothetical protein